MPINTLFAHRNFFHFLHGFFHLLKGQKVLSLSPFPPVNQSVTLFSQRQYPLSIPFFVSCLQFGNGLSFPLISHSTDIDTLLSPAGVDPIQSLPIQTPLSHTERGIDQYRIHYSIWGVSLFHREKRRKCTFVWPRARLSMLLFVFSSRSTISLLPYRTIRWDTIRLEWTPGPATGKQ